LQPKPFQLPEIPLEIKSQKSLYFFSAEDDVGILSSSFFGKLFILLNSLSKVQFYLFQDDSGFDGQFAFLNGD